MSIDSNIMLDALVAMIADRVAERLAERLAKPPAPTHYTAEHLPPGVQSWRAARERARAMGVPLIKVGRCVVIDAASWCAALERQATPPTTPSSRAVLMTNEDAAQLRALGLQ